MPTIYDVAKRADVSPATVSRVLNGFLYVSQVKRERVLQAMQELNYRPSILASALATKRTLMLGVVVHDILNPYSAMLARGAQDVMSKAGYVSIICNTDGNPETELRVLQGLRQHGVEGFVITPPQFRPHPETDAFIRELIADGLAVAFIGNRLDDASVDFVTSRAHDGAVTAVDYLVGLGHTRIGFIGGRYTQGIASGRYWGYRETLAKHGLCQEPGWAVETDLSQADGEAGMSRLLALPEPPTAVLAVNDLLAIGALLACRQHHIAVPERMSIVGFDDVLLAALATPPLTSVAQPVYEMGVQAAEMVLCRCRNPRLPPQQVTLHCWLVVRETTAPPVT